MQRFLPKSLLGQMLLSVALALLVAQGISAFLLFRAAEQRREMGALNGLAFQLVAEPRFDFRQRRRGSGGSADGSAAQSSAPRRTRSAPARQRDPDARSASCARSWPSRASSPAQLVVTTRVWGSDPYVMGRMRERSAGRDAARMGARPTCSSPRLQAPGRDAMDRRARADVATASRASSAR